jgi:hypothetical protein
MDVSVWKWDIPPNGNFCRKKIWLTLQSLDFGIPFAQTGFWCSLYHFPREKRDPLCVCCTHALATRRLIAIKSLWMLQIWHITYVCIIYIIYVILYLYNLIIFHIYIYIWLVVSTPLKNMSSSVGMIIPNIWENKSHVPNHQPDIIML